MLKDTRHLILTRHNSYILKAPFIKKERIKENNVVYKTKRFPKPKETVSRELSDT